MNIIELIEQLNDDSDFSDALFNISKNDKADLTVSLSEGTCTDVGDYFAKRYEKMVADKIVSNELDNKIVYGV